MKQTNVMSMRIAITISIEIVYRTSHCIGFNEHWLAGMEDEEEDAIVANVGKDEDGGVELRNGNANGRLINGNDEDEDEESGE